MDIPEFQSQGFIGLSIKLYIFQVILNIIMNRFIT